MKGFIVSVFNKNIKKCYSQGNGELKNGRNLDERVPRVPRGIPNSEWQLAYFLLGSKFCPAKGGLGTPQQCWINNYILPRKIGVLMLMELSHLVPDSQPLLIQTYLSYPDLLEGGVKGHCLIIKLRKQLSKRRKKFLGKICYVIYPCMFTYVVEEFLIRGC